MKKITKSIKRIIVLSMIALIVIVSANATSFNRPAWGSSKKDVIKATKNAYMSNVDGTYFHVSEKYEENNPDAFFVYHARYDKNDLFCGWESVKSSSFEQDCRDLYMDIAIVLGEKYTSIVNRYTRQDEMFFLDEASDTIIKLSVGNNALKNGTYSHDEWLISVLYMERTAYEESLADRMDILNNIL